MCCNQIRHFRLRKRGKFLQYAQLLNISLIPWITTATTPGVINHIWSVGRVSTRGKNPGGAGSESKIRARVGSRSLCRRSRWNLVPFQQYRSNLDHRRQPWYPWYACHDHYCRRECHHRCYWDQPSNRHYLGHLDRHS